MPLPPMNFIARLMEIARSSDPTACWEWPGFCANGYGKVMTTLDERGPRNWFAHRAAYTSLVGPIADDLELDHLCRNRRCMNPMHLEPVTPRVNVLRSEAITARNAKKTHCKRGHPFDEKNTLHWTTEFGTSARKCKTCLYLSNKRSVARQKAADPEAFRERARANDRRSYHRKKNVA